MPHDGEYPSYNELSTLKAHLQGHYIGNGHSYGGYPSPEAFYDAECVVDQQIARCLMPYWGLLLPVKADLMRRLLVAGTLQTQGLQSPSIQEVVDMINHDRDHGEI